VPRESETDEESSGVDDSIVCGVCGIGELTSFPFSSG